MLTLFVSQVAPLPDWIMQDAKAKTFSVSDFMGPYATSFDGMATFTLAEGPRLSVPIAAVGLLEADGAGNATLKRTLNIGGIVILEEEGAGTYTVNQNGTGKGIFNITTKNQTGTLPPGLLLPKVTQETFSAVIGEEEIEFVGTSSIDPGTQQPVAAIVVRGVLKAQKQ